MIESKICNTCEKNLEISNYSIRNNKTKKYHTRCKKCTNIYAEKYRENNKEIIKNRQKNWYLKKGKQWYIDNNKINRENIRKYEKNRYDTDKNYRIKKILRTRLNKTFTNVKRSTTMLNYLGIEYELFLTWIEYQFDDKINWDNYGTQWDIDHVWPCSKYDLTKETDIYKCFNWRNLQPLNKNANNTKSNIINYTMCINQIDKILKFESLYCNTNSLKKFNEGPEKRTGVQ